MRTLIASGPTVAAYVGSGMIVGPPSTRPSSSAKSASWQSQWRSCRAAE